MGASFNLPEHLKDIGRDPINVLTSYRKRSDCLSPQEVRRTGNAALKAGPAQEGPTLLNPPDPSRTRHASVSRYDRSFALAPIKAVVDAEFDSIDGLLDIDP
jgi:hypothetical protein